MLYCGNNVAVSIWGTEGDRRLLRASVWEPPAGLPLQSAGPCGQALGSPRQKLGDPTTMSLPE